MIDYSSFFNFLTQSELNEFARDLPAKINDGLSTKRHGDLEHWLSVLKQLPEIKTDYLNLADTVEIGRPNEISDDDSSVIEEQLKKLIPWRKGPYRLFNIEIDTEWRSDWKWNRLIDHITPLANRKVLDIGCGNGYHCWRMLGQHAKQVIGIDPSPRFVVQFYMLKHFVNKPLPVDILPLGIEQLSADLNVFDTCFSMGVFYHRRSPMDHLKELRACLTPGGELVLETLVIDGENGEILVPEDRYAMMRNVWFIPSCLTLEGWLKKLGFRQIRCVDTNQTSLEEQRSTTWMPSHSLKNFLDPNDYNLTIEGYPAPKRAIFIAER